MQHQRGFDDPPLPPKSQASDVVLSNLEVSIAEISEGKVPAGMLRRESISKKLQGQSPNGGHATNATNATHVLSSFPRQGSGPNNEDMSSLATLYQRAHVAALSTGSMYNIHPSDKPRGNSTGSNGSNGGTPNSQMPNHYGNGYADAYTRQTQTNNQNNKPLLPPLHAGTPSLPPATLNSNNSGTPVSTTAPLPPVQASVQLQLYGQPHTSLANLVAAQHTNDPRAATTQPSFTPMLTVDIANQTSRTATKKGPDGSAAVPTRPLPNTPYSLSRGEGARNLMVPSPVSSRHPSPMSRSGRDADRDSRVNARDVRELSTETTEKEQSWDNGFDGRDSGLRDSGMISSVGDATPSAEDADRDSFTDTARTRMSGTKKYKKEKREKRDRAKDGKDRDRRSHRRSQTLDNVDSAPPSPALSSIKPRGAGAEVDNNRDRDAADEDERRDRRLRRERERERERGRTRNLGAGATTSSALPSPATRPRSLSRSRDEATATPVLINMSSVPTPSSGSSARRRSAQGRAAADAIMLEVNRKAKILTEEGQCEPFIDLYSPPPGATMHVPTHAPANTMIGGPMAAPSVTAANVPAVNAMGIPATTPSAAASTASGASSARTSGVHTPFGAYLGPRVEPRACQCGTAECICGLRAARASPDGIVSAVSPSRGLGAGEGFVNANASPVDGVIAESEVATEDILVVAEDGTGDGMASPSGLRSPGNTTQLTSNAPMGVAEESTPIRLMKSLEHLRLRNQQDEEDMEREEERRNLEHFELLALKARDMVDGAANRYSKLMTMAGRHAFCTAEDLYNLIMTPHDALLMSHIAKPLLRIVDCRTRAEYLDEHIRGGLYLTDISTQCSRNALNLTSHFEQRAAALDPRNTIVFYSDGDDVGEDGQSRYSRHHANVVQAIAMVDDGVSRLFTLKGGLHEFRSKFPFLCCNVRHDISYDNTDEGGSTYSYNSQYGSKRQPRNGRELRTTRKVPYNSMLSGHNSARGGYNPAVAYANGQQAVSPRQYEDPMSMMMNVEEIPRNTVWFCPFAVPRSEMPYLREIAARQGLMVEDARLNGYYQNGHKIPGTSAFEYDPDLNVYPNLILDSWLFLGDQRCSWSLAALIDLRITHIINISTDICNYFEDHPAAQLPGGSYIKYLTIRMHDDRHSDIQSQFDMVCSFVDMAKKTDRNARIMVHCQMGISRSASLVIAYIMHLTGCSLRDVYYYVKTRRYIVQPNSGFWLQLANAERQKRGNTTVFDVMEAGLRRDAEAKCCCNIM